MTEKKPVEYITLLACVTLTLITAIVSFAYYNVNDRILMSKNIENAIAKGVDPLSVRCSYALSGDTVCVAYAAAQGAQYYVNNSNSGYSASKK